jgi:hypothetical protein
MGVLSKVMHSIFIGRCDRNQLAMDASRMETTNGMTRDLIARGEQIWETYRLRVIMGAVNFN